MAVLVPLLLGWEYPHIFLPLHVIFLELVMDPMAAIGFENEPAEPNLMRKPPRGNIVSLFTAPEFVMTLLQGVAIGAAVLFAYRFAIGNGYGEDIVRAFVFSTMVFGNMFLTLANRSFDFSLAKTIHYRNPYLWQILGASLVMLGMVLYIPQVSGLFRVGAMHADDLGWCALFAFIGVFWFEIWKVIKNRTGTGLSNGQGVVSVAE
jgi:Ca2+-transporting ATPase